MSAPARLYLLALGIVGAITGLFLLRGPDQTAEYFVWPVAPAPTAMFMGAGYLGTGITLLTALVIANSWGQVRLLVGPVAVFATLMLMATLIHRDRFFWDRPQTWLWISLYGLILIGAAWLARTQRSDNSAVFRGMRLTRGERAGLAVAGTAMALWATAMFLAPDFGQLVWPWPLTPLTARVIAGWIAVGASLGLVSAFAGDAVGTRVPLLGWMVTVALFQVTAVAALGADLDQPRARLYLLALAFSVAGSAWLLLRLQSRRAYAGI